MLFRFVFAHFLRRAAATRRARKGSTRYYQRHYQLSMAKQRHYYAFHEGAVGNNNKSQRMRAIRDDEITRSQRLR